MTRSKTRLDPIWPHEIAYFDRPGPETPIVFVHGLGNGAANFEEMLATPVLGKHRLIAMDLPGCGQSPYAAERRLCIDDLVGIVDAFVERLGAGKFLLVGASMGGLIALLYAERKPERLVGFLSAEGNLAPEDCMFSRLVVQHTFEKFANEVLPKIKADLSTKPGRGFAEHLKVLEVADPRAYYDYSFQTVEYSDHGNLLERFLALPVPQYFVYGSVNRGLSYLPRLRRSRCRMMELAGADHFMFYDAPEEFARCVESAARPSR